MSSIIEGYNYDIFISYRQKDNKGDRWVSEFVEALKTELESTFKEEISVYFDINPHDGLLETHDVDASLKEKLNCLVFIPIISRTYCDPKSFAWEHEFKAFVELSSHDQFGLKVKLPNGNVASRILPIRIYDLDNLDIKLCESVLGGVMRSIEFIYSELGVNRPLKPDDDEKINLNRTKYRNQINKVGNAIKEIISGLKNEPTESISERKEVIPAEHKPLIKEKSIIVLPFENMSPDPDQEYFSDGLTEEIITDLSHISDLQVISRSSAMTFKGTKRTIPEIAQTVNVRYVLEGSVRKAGHNLRITAQLIDALKDTHLWAEKYNGTLNDIFDFQEKVSRSISESLKLILNSAENSRISQRLILDIKVYEYYLKAKKEMDSWTEQGMDRALEYLRKALEISGDNILIYFGMGYIYFIYITIGVKNKEECILKAEEYANKIFELDADSVYGHRLLGLINVRLDLQQGVIHLKRTLEIDPNDPESIGWLVAIYCNTGKQYAAVPFIERLLKTDPFNGGGLLLYSLIELLNGHFTLALERSYKCHNMYLTHPSSLLHHALILAYNNHLDESYSICDQNLKNNPGHIMAQISKCLKFALQGNKNETFKAMSGGVKSKARCDMYDSWIMAVCDALINEKDEAITSLECSINLGAVNYPFYSEIDPFLENIRGEERFKKLMERVKYEWENFEV